MIERRELLMAGAGLAAAGALAAPAAAQHHSMEGMAMPMTDCVDHCITSHRMCLETAAYVTNQGGALATAALIAMLTDCAEICQTTANSMLRQSTFHRILCRAVPRPANDVRKNAFAMPTTSRWPVVRPPARTAPRAAG